MDPKLLLESALKSDTTESVGFLNDMMSHMWPFINPAVAKTVKQVVEPMFEDLLPGPFKSTQFKKVELGAVSPAFDRVDVTQRSKNSVKLDVDVRWDGHCDIELHSPIVGNYGVEKIKLSGRLCVIFQPLLTEMPVVGAIQAAFQNPPVVDLDFTGLADVADCRLIRGAIRKVIMSVISSILVQPNYFLVPVAPCLDYFSTVITPTGVVRLTLESGAGFKTTGRLVKDVPDVYCKVALGAAPLARSATCNNANSPTWTDQSFDFLYSDPDQIVSLHVFDDDVVTDDKLGGVLFPLSLLLDDPDKRVTVPLRADDQPTGATITLHADVRPFSTDKSKFDTPDAALTDSSNVKLGLLTIVLAGAKGIPDQPDLAPFVRTTVGDECVFKSPVVMKTPMVDPRTPNFNSVYRIEITPAILQEKPPVRFELFSGKIRLGACVAPFEDVLDAPAMTIQKECELENGAVLQLGLQLRSLA